MDGIGANSEIPSHKLFSQYKRLFVNNWDTPYVLDLVGKVNQRVFGKTKARMSGTATMNDEDLTANIDAAMAAMAMALPEPDSDSEFPDLKAGPEPPFGLPFHVVVETTLSNSDVTGTNNERAPTVLLVPGQNIQAGEASLETEQVALDEPEEHVSTRGCGRVHGNKGNKAAAASSAVTRCTRRSTVIIAT